MTKIDELIDAYKNSQDKDAEWSGAAWEHYRDLKKRIEKKLEAFDIIIKNSYISLSKETCATLSIINKDSYLLGTIISDEEYDLLKEVLK